MNGQPLQGQNPQEETIPGVAASNSTFRETAEFQSTERQEKAAFPSHAAPANKDVQSTEREENEPASSAVTLEAKGTQTEKHEGVNPLFGSGSSQESLEANFFREMKQLGLETSFLI